MPNPARQLLETFQRWNQRNTAPQNARGLNDDEARQEHVQAMAWVKAIIGIVEQIEASKGSRPRYRKAIPMWIDAVLSYPYGWTDKGVNQKLFHARPLENLEGLADEIDLLVPDLNEVQRAQASAVLDQIADLLSADEDIDDRLQLYIHRLLQHSRDCLEDYYALGRFELQEALERLWVALHAAENQSKDPENKKRWAGFQGFWPTAAGTAVGGLPQALLALTTGG